MERVELSLRVGLTLLDGLGAGVESPDGRLDLACNSLRWVAMRSTMDCRPVGLCWETLGDDRSGVGLGDAPAPIRLPTLLEALEPVLPLRDDGNDLSLKELRLSGLVVRPIERSLVEGVRLGAGAETDGCDGLDRIDGADGLGLIEVLGRLGLTDGLLLTDGLGRLSDGLGDGLGRLGLTEGLGLGDGDLDRLDIRSSIPPLGVLGLGGA